jgi:hypothetical protein
MTTSITTALLLGAAVLSSTALGAEVDRREARQQARIAQGVKSGQLTPRETARLETREAHIDGEVARERAANGGHLTPAERARVNRQQDRLSGAIYRQKHDAQAR